MRRNILSRRLLGFLHLRESPKSSLFTPSMIPTTSLFPTSWLGPLLESSPSLPNRSFVSFWNPSYTYCLQCTTLKTDLLAPQILWRELMSHKLPVFFKNPRNKFGFALAFERSLFCPEIPGLKILIYPKSGFRTLTFHIWKAWLSWQGPIR